ncbi:hypothetical protein [Novipirellula sp.]|uniref:hypothetical protein n=1 Tax=Novipirellula sp. TaxID=2795430 RepID=UPI0035676CEF
MKPRAVVVTPRLTASLNSSRQPLSMAVMSWYSGSMPGKLPQQTHERKQFV